MKTLLMLEDFRLQVFMSVVQERSFTKAANSLGVTQPAVSQNIAELEKIVGMKLFDRLRGETVLTPEGEIFKVYAKKMLATCMSAENMFAKLSPAVVRIAVSEELYNYLVAPSLETFTRVHPEISFQRCMFDDADVSISLKPSGGSPYDVPADSIARIRMSVYPAPKMGDLSATHEQTSYFDVMFQPTALFSCTRLCRLLREFLIS